MMDGHTVSAIAGFIALGLSPSFVDWQQSPDKRGDMVLFYAIGIGLIFYGLEL